MPEEQNSKERTKTGNQNQVDDDEQRIRDRLRAKLESRNLSLNSSKGAASSTVSAPANGSRTKENGSSNREKGSDEKNDGVSSTSRRRRRRHRGRGNRRGNAGGPSAHRNPFVAPSHMMGPPPRGSRSPPGGVPPPGFYPPGRGYGPPPPSMGPYSRSNYPPPYASGPPPLYGYDWRGPYRGPPPPYGRYDGNGGKLDDFGRRLPPRRGSRSRSRSPNDDSYRRGRSYSRSRSRSSSRNRRRSRSRSRSSSGSSSSESVSSRSVSSRSTRSSKSYHSSRRSSSASSRSLSDEDSKSSRGSTVQDGFTKDQRTVFVTQLVMRTTGKDIQRFFRKQGIKTNEVILLRDKRTGRHKGSAYVELRKMDDLVNALALSGKPPDFQRFPVLIKSSEAEKNYTLGSKSISTNTTTTSPPGGAIVKAPVPIPQPPLVGPNGKFIQAQKLYVGNLDPSVSQEHLFALFNPFGQLEQVTIQKNDDGVSKGFAFLQFRDPREANLALQTMSGQLLAGRPIKTGWANQVSANPSVEVVTSQEFPEDSTSRAQTAYMVLAQLSTVAAPATTVVPLFTTNQPESTSLSGVSRIPTVAEARASLAAHGVGGMNSAQNLVMTSSVDATKIGNASLPSKTVLVHNMFDKDEETDLGWQDDIRDEFQEECSKYGTIIKVLVMHTEPGGKIYATFDSIEGAQNCASNLAGRWFDKRQLRVEFVPDSAVPASAPL